MSEITLESLLPKKECPDLDCKECSHVARSTSYEQCRGYMKNVDIDLCLTALQQAQSLGKICIVPSRQELQEVFAQTYCLQRHMNKTLDVTLAEDTIEAILNLLIGVKKPKRE